MYLKSTNLNFRATLHNLCPLFSILNFSFFFLTWLFVFSRKLIFFWLIDTRENHFLLIDSNTSWRPARSVLILLKNVFSNVSLYFFFLTGISVHFCRPCYDGKQVLNCCLKLTSVNTIFLQRCHHVMFLFFLISIEVFLGGVCVHTYRIVSRALMKTW